MDQFRGLEGLAVLGEGFLVICTCDDTTVTFFYIDFMVELLVIVRLILHNVFYSHVCCSSAVFFFFSGETFLPVKVRGSHVYHGDVERASDC